MQIRKLGLLVVFIISCSNFSFSQASSEEDEDAENYLRIKPHHSVTFELEPGASPPKINDAV